MYIRVHAVPGARKERVVKDSSTEYTIHVKELAERNMANMRIREILAEAHGVSVNKIRMVTGHRSPTKMYTIE